MVSTWLVYGKSMDNLWIIYGYLVGGLKPSETYDIVSWDDYSEYMEKMFPTTRYSYSM